MRVIQTVAGLRCWRMGQTGSLGLVPTQGVLHQGHLSLIRRARRDNDLVVVSIFLNPLQAGLQESYTACPRPLEEELQRCRAAGVDCVFAPAAEDFCGPGYGQPGQLTVVSPPASLIQGLCGRFLDGYFTGVATAIAKLLTIVLPQRAYLGQKDAQQLTVVRRVAQDLNLPGIVIGCPTVRDRNGLALSSRNRYLTAQERQQAAILYRGLNTAKEQFKTGERSQLSLVGSVLDCLEAAPAVSPQYVELVNPYTLDPLDTIETVGMLAVAAFVGTTRLIDNVVLRARRPIVAIDGPAGAGKSTVARQLAHRLGLLYLDTGAMYRAVTWYVLSQGVDPQDEVGVAELLPRCDIRLVATPSEGEVKPPQVWVNDTQVTQAIREPRVTAQVSAIAAQADVRRTLVQQQMSYGATGGVVADGRDIGTHVFPDAELKVFLTASVEERARRRQRDLAEQRQAVPPLEELAQAISSRDRKDSTREIAPLRQADDAIELVTDSLSIDEVLDKLLSLYQERVVAQAE